MNFQPYSFKEERTKNHFEHEIFRKQNIYLADDEWRHKYKDYKWVDFGKEHYSENIMKIMQIKLSDRYKKALILSRVMLSQIPINIIFHICMFLRKKGMDLSDLRNECLLAIFFRFNSISSSRNFLFFCSISFSYLMAL